MRRTIAGSLLTKPASGPCVRSARALPVFRLSAACRRLFARLAALKGSDSITLDPQCPDSMFHCTATRLFSLWCSPSNLLSLLDLVPGCDWVRNK